MEANDRGWCREYDTIMDDLNRSLTVELPHRQTDYTITYDITVSVSRSASGRDSDDAFGSDTGPTTQDIIDAVRNGSWTQTDYEVEED